MTPWRFLLGVLLVVVVPVAGAAPASADPAGPTDYRTDIVDIVPETGSVALRMIGGDSFLHLVSDPGTAVTVVGYRGEDYLRFDPDGTVWRNENSPSRWLNDDRYAAAAVPPTATPGAEPEWVVVAGGGSYAWHDHRTHWMQTVPPPGVRPGDVVLEATIPLMVDGVPTLVHVRSVRLGSPSMFPLAVAVAAALVALVAGFRASAGRGVAAVVAGWAFAATALGVWAVVSLPGEVGPGAATWSLPAVAAVTAAAALVLGSGRGPVVPLLQAVAGGALFMAVFARRSALTHALIPSDAPELLDRVVIAGGFVVGAGAVVAGAGAVVAATRTPAGQGS